MIMESMIGNHEESISLIQKLSDDPEGLKQAIAELTIMQEKSHQEIENALDTNMQSVLNTCKALSELPSQRDEKISEMKIIKSRIDKEVSEHQTHLSSLMALKTKLQKEAENKTAKLKQEKETIWISSFEKFMQKFVENGTKDIASLLCIFEEANYIPQLKHQPPAVINAINSRVKEVLLSFFLVFNQAGFQPMKQPHAFFIFSKLCETAETLGIQDKLVLLMRSFFEFHLTSKIPPTSDQSTSTFLSQNFDLLCQNQPDENASGQRLFVLAVQPLIQKIVDEIDPKNDSSIPWIEWLAKRPILRTSSLVKKIELMSEIKIQDFIRRLENALFNFDKLSKEQNDSHNFIQGNKKFEKAFNIGLFPALIRVNEDYTSIPEFKLSSLRPDLLILFFTMMKRIEGFICTFLLKCIPEGLPDILSDISLLFETYKILAVKISSLLFTEDAKKELLELIINVVETTRHKIDKVSEEVLNQLEQNPSQQKVFEKIKGSASVKVILKI